MRPRPASPGRRTRPIARPVRRKPDRHDTGRAVLAAEPLEDRSQPSAAADVTPAADPVPLSLTALVSPLMAPAARTVVSSAATGLPELSHRLTSLDLGPAPDPADQLAGVAAAPAVFPAAIPGFSAAPSLSTANPRP